MYEAKLKLALDFDETYALAAPFWDAFISLAQAYGHEVRFVTYRPSGSDNMDIEIVAEAHGLVVHYTGGVQKATYCKRAGWIPDIWIDDAPETIPSARQLEAMARGAQQDEALLANE